MSTSSGYVRHFIACNQHDLSHFVPFYIGGKPYGRITRELSALLSRETGLFVAQDGGLALAPQFTDFATRSEALLQASRLLAEHYKTPLTKEMYAVVQEWGEEPIAQIDRIVVSRFGVRAWGIHINGFVRKADGIYLWIGERAADRRVDPGKLDNMVGGGQPIGLTLEENVCKEAWEEAGIKAPLASTAKLAQTMNYFLERPTGLRTDTLFIFDLELPESFTPRNTDGEVASFTLMPLAQVAKLVRETDKFKFNCNLVIADFLMRFGFITKEDKEYEELAKWLKR